MADEHPTFQEWREHIGHRGLVLTLSANKDVISVRCRSRAHHSERNLVSLMSGGAVVLYSTEEDND